jgi:pimeloyl-ACP methyl ester carboxylesterase
MKKRNLLAGLAGLAVAGIATKLLMRPDDVSWSAAARDLRHAEDSYFVTVGGVRLHYLDSGPEDGPTIFLIHGFVSSSQVWGDIFLPLVEAGFRVIAPDLAGYGFSEKPREFEYTIEKQAELVIGLMDRLGFASVDLVGSSYGGAIAAICALDYPDRINRLVLVDAIINNDATRQPLLQLALLPGMGELICPFLLDSKTLMRWRMGRIYHRANVHLMTEDRLRMRHLPLRTARTHHAVSRTLRNWNAVRVENEARHITQPTLILWGDSDLDTPLEHGKLLLREIPDSRLFIFRNCGHIPQEEYPELFVQFLDSFLHAGEISISRVTAAEPAENQDAVSVRSLSAP